MEIFFTPSSDFWRQAKQNVSNMPLLYQTRRVTLQWGRKGAFHQSQSHNFMSHNVQRIGRNSETSTSVLQTGIANILFCFCPEYNYCLNATTVTQWITVVTDWVKVTAITQSMPPILDYYQSMPPLLEYYPINATNIKLLSNQCQHY